MANQNTNKNANKNTTASAPGKKTQSSANSTKQQVSNQGDKFADEKKDCPFIQIYKEHPNTMVLTLLGLIVALCFIILGFWATILIVLFTGAGFIYGQYRDKELWVYHVLKRLLK